MFKNVMLEFGADASLHARWDWVDNKDGSVPSCQVFYCSLPENKLLVQGLFLEDEILNYFNDNVIRIYSPDVRQEIMSYWERNKGTCRLNKIQRDRFDKENRQLPISPDALDHIFLVCIFDETDIIFRIIAGSSGQPILFHEIKPGFLQKMLKKETRQAIQLRQNDSRKKVAEIRSGKSVTYSVLPEGHSQYYFDESVNLSAMKIYYLSSLIGKEEN